MKKKASLTNKMTESEFIEMNIILLKMRLLNLKMESDNKRKLKFIDTIFDLGKNTEENDETK